MIPEFGVLILGDKPMAWLRETAVLVEELGYDQLWHADEKFFRDGYISLALVAEHARRIRLGIAVTDPYSRHPALTAMATATLSDLAPGRITLGVGAGGSGFQSLGIARQRPVAAIRESVDLMRRLWAGAPVAYAGEVVRFHGGALEFRPAEPIRIAIASSSKQVLQLAGQIGDAAMIGDYAAGPGLGRAVEAVKVGCQRVGRSPVEVPLIARLNVAISEDREAVIRAMKPWIGIPLWNRFGNWKSLLNYDPAWEDRLAALKAVIASQEHMTSNVADTSWVQPYLDLIPDEFVFERCLAGTADQVRRQVERVFESGVSQLVIYPMPVSNQSCPEVIRRFAESVIQPIRRAAKEESSPLS